MQIKDIAAPMAAGIALAAVFAIHAPRRHEPETAGHLKGNCIEVSDSFDLAPGKYYPGGNGYVFSRGETRQMIDAEIVNHTGSKLIHFYDRASGISTVLTNDGCYQLPTKGGLIVSSDRGKLEINDMKFDL